MTLRQYFTFRVPQLDDNQRSPRGLPFNPHQGARPLDLETQELLRPLGQRRQQRWQEKVRPHSSEEYLLIQFEMLDSLFLTPCCLNNNNNGEDCEDDEKVIPKIRLQGPFGGGNQGSTIVLAWSSHFSDQNFIVHRIGTNLRWRL